MARKSARISQDNQEPSGAGHANVHATSIAQKTDFAAVIGTDERKNNRLFFAALITIDRTDFDALFFSAELFQESCLSDVGGEKRNGFGWKTGFSQFLIK